MIKTLFRSIRDYRKVSLLAPFMIIVETALFSIIPLLIAKIIDFGINTGNMRNVYSYGLQLFIVTILMIIFGVLGGSYAAKGAAGFAKNLRHDVFYKIQEYSFSNIDKYNSSSLIVRLTTDIQRLQMTYQMFIRLAFRAPSCLIFACVMAFSINKQLSMTFLIVIPIFMIILAIIIKVAFPRFEKVFKEYDNLNNVVKENLDGIRVVKAFVREKEETEKFKEKSFLIEKLYISAYKLTILAMPMMMFAIFIVNIIIIFYGSKMVISNTLSTGDLVGLVNYVGMALFSLIMLSVVFVMATVSLASAKRVVEVLQEVPEILNPVNGIKKIEKGSIEFENVNFSYLKRADKLCLENINLKIESGNKVGIIGSTGSSKSTLVNLLPRLYDVDFGKVKISGIDVKKYDLTVLRDNVSFVLQKSVLFSGSIEENLRWGNKEASIQDIEKACKIAQAHSFINKLDEKYSYHIEQGGLNVSGGQRQRLCIARALLKKPKIIVFDDATSAVDMATEARIRHSLSTELPDLTQLIIAQRIVSVKDCDIILVMDKGKIVGKGKHEDLLKNNEIYKKVYETQMREVEDASI